MSNGTLLHPFYNGIGSSNSSTTSLPIQTVGDSEKNEKWKRLCLDSLESIGVSQLAENESLRDFYKMVNSKLVYSDFGIDDNSVLNQVMDLGDGIGVPTFLKHYDFIGIIARKLIGEWANQRDNFKIAATDEISDNDYLRERTRQMQQFATETFKNELNTQLAKMGIHPEEQGRQFESEEEQQQYLQQLEQEKAKIITPEYIEKELSKNFKVKAVEWAEHTTEKDQQRFHLDELDNEEMKDFLLTGRYFRHYYIGYDYYKPERWSPLQTFFSKDVDAKYPQDGEYVGRIFYLSVSDIIKRYGHLLKPTEIKMLTKRFGEIYPSNVNSTGQAFKNSMSDNLFGQTQTVPFHNYYDYDLGLQFQDALGIPMGENFTQNSDGELSSTPHWLSPFQNKNYLGNRYAQLQRDDFSVRTDLLQVTEAYWRSQKRMWFLSYKTQDGQNTTEIVTDELLPEFIKENGIRKKSTKSLKDLQTKELEEDVMYEFWIPEVRQGIKINSGNSLMGDNIYLGGEPLEYQIKGDSNVFDVKLPVAGIISESMAQRLRPYQIGYNVCLNQIFNLLEKEIGMFFLFDINFLPSEYKDNGTIEDSLLKLKDLAKDVGLVPLDTTKQNMQGANAQMNTFMAQDISFTNQINSRIQLSTYYYQKALEQIGITPQRLGQTNVYETATGVQQGVEATYDQTMDIFTTMSIARRKSMELHLAVAQFCQKDYVDVDMIFQASDGDRHYLNLTDPDFPLRRLGILPSQDPKKRRDLEQLRQVLMQHNTLGTITDFASLFISDTMQELLAMGQQADKAKQREVEAQRQHEQQLLDKQLQAQAQEKQAERDFKASESQKERETKIEIEQIDAYGKLYQKSADETGFDRIQEATQTALDNDYKQQELSMKQSNIDNKNQIDSEKLKRIDEDLKLRVKELELKQQQMNNDRAIAILNKN